MAHLATSKVLGGVEQAVLAKLAEYDVSLNASDDDLRAVFANAVAPNRCFQIAKELQNADLTRRRDEIG